MNDIISTAVISAFAAVVTALSLGILHYFLPTRTEKLSKQRSAALIASHLERFAIDCADLLQRYENYIRSNGSTTDVPNQIAKFEEFSDEIDLTSISAEHASEALAIQNLVILTQKSTSSYLDIVADYDDLQKMVMEFTALLGNRSMKLGLEMRRSYGLPKPDYLKLVWNIEEYLSDAETEYCAKKER